MDPAAPEEQLFNTQFKKDMQQLQNAFLDKLSDTVRDMKALKPEFNAGIAKLARIETAYHAAHNLAGAGIIFGFPEASAVARTLYAALRPLLDLEQHSDAQVAAQREAAPYVLHFISICEDICLNRAAALERMVLPAAEAKTLAQDTKDVYIIARDYAQSEDMITRLTQFGYRAVLVEDEARLKSALRQGQAKAVLIFSDLDAHDAAVIRALLQTEHEDGVRAPLIVLSGKGDFATRLEAARLGARGFFSGTPDALKIVERIEALAAQARIAPHFHALIVDDDDMLAEFYKNALRREGMGVTVVSDASNALSMLEEHDIDLILVDSTMPSCTGLELRAVIRQHERLRNIPLMIMAPAEDAEAAVARHADLAMDDFIIKPFSPEYLVSLIRTRAIRLTETKAFVSHDHFTGLLNHEQFNQALAREILRVRRHKSRSCYATLDLDHFRDINAAHGHAAGDGLIKLLARMLQQHLRRTDIVGRCGGQRFGIIMPGCDANNAERSLETLRAAFTDQFYAVGKGMARVTFSCGLAPIKGTDTLESLINDTDKALGEAKKTGRNRIVAVHE